MTALTCEYGIEMADYILENTDEPNGMVNAWKTQCISGRATYRMLQLLEEKYNEIK